MDFRFLRGSVPHFIIVTVLGCLLGASEVVQAQPVDAGFRGPAFPSNIGGDEEVTAEKPESKLWWNDGIWWSGLWSSAASTYRIHRLDMATQQWVDTGTALDSRQGTKMDVFWDDKPVIPTDRKLYVASHHWTTSAGAGTSSQHGRLYRYSYDWAAKHYNLDSGFPVDINSAKTEALTIAKDSTGQLWATWVQSQQVMVNHTLNGNDASWGTPFVLPTGSMANVSSDDLSAITAFDGDKIIVMWSRQSTQDQMLAATHVDGTPDANWNLVTAYTTSGDDHMNIKALNDSAGQLFAVVKTANSAANTGLIVVLVCTNTATNCTQTSDWASYPVYASNGGTFDATRAILLIDQTNRRLYVFASLSYSGDRAIFYKSTNIDNIQFAPGMGELFIFEDGRDANNPSSTKQNLDGTTDLVVLASAADSNAYYHNWINLASPSGPEIDVTPISHDYGGVVVGANALRTFAIRNLGGTNLQLTGATLGGGQASEFAITPGGAPVTVAPGTTHYVEVRFTPAMLGLRATTLQLTSDDADEGQVNVPLSGNGTVAAPDIAVTPTSYGFGTQPVGIGITQNFTVSNTGTMNLSVGAPTLWGPNAGEFAITSGQAGFPIAPSGNNTIQVRFLAQTAGPKSATLRIPSNDPDENPVDVALTGTGNVGGTTPTFEELQQGGSINSTSVTTATNLTGVTGHLYLAAISATHHRTVSAVTGLGVTWTRVAEQCGGRGRTGIELWWAQGAATTGSVTATLESAPDAAEIAVARYSGVAATNPVSPLVAANTNGVNGGCSGGNDDTAYSLGVTTTASQAVVLGVVAIRYRTHTPGSGYTERAEVAIGSGGSVAAIALVDRSVAGASSLLLNGSFDGDVDWAVIGIELRPGASGPAPDIDALPTPHNYGAILVGGNASQTFAIKNVGNANLQVSSASLVGGQTGEFSIAQGGAGFTVTPGATHNLDVQFAPTSGGSKATTLRLMSDDPDESQVDVALSGSGATPQEIDVSPAPYNYGSVSLGTTAVRTFAIRNLGGTTLHVTGVTLTGDQVNDFAITAGGGSFNVLPGATHNLDVSFAPAALGGRTTTLRFTNDDADENPFNVALTGTGVASVPEVVVTPASHNYGTQPVGVQVTQTFTITNTGTAPLVVGASSVSGDTAAFVITSGQSGFTIPPNQNNTIQVRFTAPSTGLKTATLSIPTNDVDENPVLVELSGTGTVGSTVPTFEEVQHGGSTGLATVTTATSVTGVTGHLYLAAISSKSYRTVNTVTGLGLTWTRVATQCAGRNQTGIELWWARGSATTGTVTATLATAPSTALIVVSRYSGVASTNPIGLAVAGNTNGINGACSNGNDSGAYSFNVTTTQNNSVIVGAAAIRTKTHTPGAGYTERGELVQGSGSDTVTIAVSERAVPTMTSLPLNGTLSGAVDWAVLGVELRPGP